MPTLSLFGSPWLHHARCGSTSDEARALGRAGKPHGTVVTADEQSHGRGRQGRSWFSPPGDNLYLSLLLRPQLQPRDVPLLTLCAGLAIEAAALDFLRSAGLPASEDLLVLKWPNDLLAKTSVGLRKVAGILTEMTLSGSRCDFVIVGVGVNVSGLQFPDGVPATSLRQLLGPQTPPLSVHDFAVTLLSHFEPLYQRFVSDGSGWVIDAFSTRAHLTAAGQRLHVQTASGPISGDSLGIDRDGALLIRRDDGYVERLLSGDVSLGTASL